MKVINVRDAGPSDRWMDGCALRFVGQVGPPSTAHLSAAQNETLDSDIEERCRGRPGVRPGIRPGSVRGFGFGPGSLDF